MLSTNNSSSTSFLELDALDLYGEPNSFNELPVIGIDIGASACTISYYLNNNLETIYTNLYDLNKFNCKTFPTCAIVIDQQIYVGQQALQKAKENPKLKLVDDLKRLMNQDTQVLPDYPNVNLTTILSLIMLKLKEKVERETGLPVFDAVLTVPATYGEKAKSCLIDAAVLANLNVVRILNEPTSAALYYSCFFDDAPQTILVIDLGSLTLDMSLCTISRNYIDVETTRGATNCGSYSINKKLKEYLISKLQLKYPDLRKKLVKNLELEQLIQALKIQLTGALLPNIRVRKNLIIDEQEYLIDVIVEKNLLEDFYYEYFQQLKQNYDQLFDGVNFKEEDVKYVILTGGPASNSYIRDKLAEFVKPHIIPDYDNLGGVSKGAALHTAMLTNLTANKKLLTDVTSISLGVETEGGKNEIIVPSNTRLPCKRKLQFVTTSRNQKIAKIIVLEGERPFSNQCTVLGELSIELDYLEGPKPKTIEIIFELDVSGMLTCKAKDRDSNGNHLVQSFKPSYKLDANYLKIRQDLIKNRKADTQMINDLNISLKLRELLLNLKNYSKNLVLPVEKRQVFNDACKQLKKNPVSYERLKEFVEKIELLLIEVRGSIFGNSNIKKI